MIEDRIGDYVITQSLGKGGFGSVWKATAGNGNDVAIKVLNPQARESDRVVKKFFNEAMILAKLAHPNICKVFEFFPHGDNYCIVMEYIEGTELKSIFRQIRVPFGLANKIARQTLAGFQYAHDSNILHRDIKPGNIMINTHSNCKIMDFGIAKITSSASHDTANSMLSVHYVPPERFDRNRDIDIRSDIYSLGLVFYELFAGRRPFNAKENTEIMYCHLNDTPEPPSKYAQRLPANIDRAILKALEKNPDDRFNDFAEFSSAMEIVDEGRPDETIVTDITGEIRYPRRETDKHPKTADDTGKIPAIPEHTTPTDFFDDTGFPRSQFITGGNVNFDGLLESMLTHRDQLDRAYRTLRKQADTAYRLWMGCAGLGVAILLMGIVGMFFGELLKGAVIAGSTVIVFYLRHIFQQREDHYQRQARKKHAHLAYGNHWLLAIQSIASIQNPSEKQKQQAKIIDALASKLKHQQGE